MALQPSLRPLVVAGAHDADHTLEFYLDFVCPFSAKSARTINSVLKPLCDPAGPYHGSVKIILRLQVQSWHAASTFTHEAALAVLRVAPEEFWTFCVALFEHQEQYFDKAVANLTPIQTRAKLAELASLYISKSALQDFNELLKLKGSANGGVGVTDDLKYNIKMARQNGIHVSPTVLWDGLVHSDISSSWGEQEWTDFLKARV